MPWKNSVKQKEYQKNYVLTHKEQRKQWEKNNPDKMKLYSKRNTLRKKQKYASDVKYREKIRDSNNTAQLKKLIELKEVRDNILKKVPCENCGFSDFRALIIHHIEGNKHHRGRERSYYLTLKEIAENKVPYRVLCRNCHAILHYNNHNKRQDKIP